MSSPAPGPSSPPGFRAGPAAPWFCGAESRAEASVAARVPNRPGTRAASGPPRAHPLVRGAGGSADPGKGQPSPTRGLWGSAGIPGLPTDHGALWRRRAPEEEVGEAGRGSHRNRATSRRWFAGASPTLLAVSAGHCPGPWPAWLPRPPAVIVVLFLGKAPLRSPPAPHTWEPQVCRAFSAELSRNPPQGQGPAKGPIHHKRSCFHFPGPRR